MEYKTMKNRNEIEELFLETNSMSPLMDDRDKISTEDIIGTYSKGITIDRFDKVTVGEDEFYVFTFKENEDVFAFSGYVLAKFFDALVSKYEDIENANEALENNGGIKVILESSKTKKNQPITTVKLA